MSQIKTITKSIRLDTKSSKKLKEISQEEGVSEAAILKRFILKGIAEQRLEKAVVAYQRGEADLSAAAKYAEISVYHMMNELVKRDISVPADAEKFVSGLKTLMDTFGGSAALEQTITSLDLE